ncbi:MAG: DUF1549 and DUF1553 domain-containing protein [Verrucomicrobia bacterium]|nr:DUF1549 and DUF1553 domain-containing protein [Verrucomicrobiota bacterium]
MKQSGWSVFDPRSNLRFGRALVLACLVLRSISAEEPERLEKDRPAPEEFWSFRSLLESPLPSVQSASWGQSPIDRFILARLEAAQLEPAPPADRRSLIRRATYDLTGLPPSQDEIEEFLNDSSPDAFERVIERLLASPRYGEKWGRHWLDVARYADSNGLDENLAYANAFHYRDYVIDAFNMDLPYNRFIDEQLAGDLLEPEPDDSSAKGYRRLIATGFLSIGPKMLACDDGRKMEMDIIDEQVDTVGRAFMGLTMGCARCHDHKFDPISTADYYSLASVFKSTKTMENFKVVAEWHEYTLAPVEEQARVREIEKSVRKKDQELKDRIHQAEEAFVEGERMKAGQYFASATTFVEFPSSESAAGSKRGESEIETAAKEADLNVEILKQWIDYLRSAASEPVKFLEPLLHSTIGQKPETVSHIQMLFEQAEQLARASESKPAGGDGKSLSDPDLEAARLILYDSKGPFRLPKNSERFFAKNAADDVARLKSEKSELEQSAPVLPRAIGVCEGKPMNLKVHLRGNYLTLGDDVIRGFPSFLTSGNTPAIGETESGRLELARWLTNPKHPLTARVMANRIWLWHFGEGLVRSADNFGKLGEPPANRALLDWLALRFQASGWSMKEMHRCIMLSSSYQMNSAHNALAYETDPENLLWWKFPKRRLTAEEIRDTLLVAGESLGSEMHGQRLPSKNRDYVTGTSSKEGTYSFPCRSVYLPILRSAVYDVFQAFDFPDPSVLNGKRATTTVAPQALFLMNGEIVLQQSRSLAENLINRNEMNDRGRVQLAYNRLFGRPPDAREVDDGLDFIRDCAAALESEGVRDAGAQRVRAWQGLCRVLMASNEFVYLN